MGKLKRKKRARRKTAIEGAGQPTQASEALETEARLRNIIEKHRTMGDSGQLRHYLEKLAALLQSQPHRLAEARHAAEQALTAAHSTLDPTATWTICGVLAGILEQEAKGASDVRRSALLAQASYYRQLNEYAPQFVIALAQSKDFGQARALVLGRLGCCFHLAGRPELAVQAMQEALVIANEMSPDDMTQGLRAMVHLQLADALAALGQHSEAKHSCETALLISRELLDCRGQALAQGRLGTFALLEGKRDEALICLRSALSLAQKFSATSLEAIAWYQIGRILREQHEWEDAEHHYLEAARLLEAGNDQRGVAQLRNELAVLRAQAGSSHAGQAADPTASPSAAKVEGGSVPSSAENDQEFQIRLHDHISTEYAFEPNLLIDGWQEDRITHWTPSNETLTEDVRPLMIPCARVYLDETGAVRIALPQGELCAERQPGYTAMRRLRREVRVSGNSRLIWDLIREMDGSRTIAEILTRLPVHKRASAARLLTALAAVRAVDVSGRAVGRFLHTATKKGVLPAGGLVGDEILSLATDGDYRIYPDVPQLPLHPSIPEGLRSFRALTRARRSRRDYSGISVGRLELEALLDTACGVTGSTQWAGRETKLRAYPSSGALYAVEIYLLALQVDGLDPGIYHYRVVENMLEVVKPTLDRQAILGAMLPMERKMVGGSAAMLCLTGNFPRHERKYGEGGYRMLIAEAGHISQNVVLGATALGLAARPFGGVFDALLNAELGLDQNNEEFLLAVLIGRAGGEQNTSRSF